MRWCARPATSRKRARERVLRHDAHADLVGDQHGVERRALASAAQSSSTRARIAASPSPRSSRFDEPQRQAVDHDDVGAVELGAAGRGELERLLERAEVVAALGAVQRDALAPSRRRTPAPWRRTRGARRAPARAPSAKLLLPERAPPPISTIEPRAHAPPPPRGRAPCAASHAAHAVPHRVGDRGADQVPEHGVLAGVGDVAAAPHGAATTMQSVPVPVAGRPLRRLATPPSSTARVRASATIASISTRASSATGTEAQHRTLIVPGRGRRRARPGRRRAARCRGRRSPPHAPRGRPATRVHVDVAVERGAVMRPTAPPRPARASSRGEERAGHRPAARSSSSRTPHQATAVRLDEATARRSRSESIRCGRANRATRSRPRARAGVVHRDAVYTDYRLRAQRPLRRLRANSHTECGR